MNILYFIPNISQKGGGLRQYSVALLKILAQDTSNRYFILHQVNDPQVMEVIQNNPHLFHISPNLGKERFYERILRKIFNFLNFYFLFTKKKRKKGFSYVNRLCRKYKIDIVHCPYQETPITSKAKTICTLHDVQELHFPEFFTPEVRLERAYHYLDILKRADSVVVSYQHIKDDLIKYFPFLSSEKIEVCLLNMQYLWFDKLNDSDLIKKNELNVPEKFVMYAANVWTHKNHLNLIKAIQLLKTQGEKINLICTGHKKEYYFSTLEPYIKEHQLEEQIVFKGLVSEAELYSLYQQCTGVVIPTLYEAGSFPLMESILMNIPVICSNTTSLPETIGDPSFIFDPNNVEDIAELVRKIWNDSEFRTLSMKNNLKQQKHLKETNAFNIIQERYNLLLAKN